MLYIRVGTKYFQNKKLREAQTLCFVWELSLQLKLRFLVKFIKWKCDFSECFFVFRDFLKNSIQFSLVFFYFFTQIVCGIGLIYMVLTTWEAERVNRFLQKQSMEGTWASFTDPISLASLFINLAFGTYFIVTFCLFIGHLYGDSKTVGETLLLVIGCLMMISVGGILVVSIDDVPEKIFDNTVVLGVLALIAAVLLLTDAGTKCASKPKIKKETPASKKKKDIEIVPSEHPKKEVEIVEEKLEEQNKEEEPKKQSEEPVKENSISSVEIRIKDPKKNWPVYGERTRATSEIDVLAEAEAVDKMLSRGVALGRARGHLPRLSESPVRHTSSFYITQAPQFAWKRLSEK